MNEFDKKALDWDNEPKRCERAKKVAETIINNIIVSENMTAFEYGCGTGLLSFNLLPSLKSITLADSSEGMLSVLNEKINKFSISNMTTCKLDLTQDPKPNDKFDLIYTLMTMHHIVEFDKVLNALSEMLNSSGYLCIADLVEEDGSFHGNGFIGHNGFNKEEIEKKISGTGLQIVHYEKCYDAIKKTEDGSTKVFPIFVVIAQKVAQNRSN